MTRLELRSRVGSDGVLTLRIPVGKGEANQEVLVTVESAGGREVAAIEEKFEALADVWRKECRGRSVINYSHPVYCQIVAMGWPVVPLLLGEVAAGAGTWYIALQYITGERPEPAGARGDAAAVRAAWVEWGRNNGYAGAMKPSLGDRGPLGSRCPCSHRRR